MKIDKSMGIAMCLIGIVLGGFGIGDTSLTIRHLAGVVAFITAGYWLHKAIDGLSGEG